MALVPTFYVALMCRVADSEMAEVRQHSRPSEVRASLLPLLDLWRTFIGLGTRNVCGCIYIACLEYRSALAHQLEGRLGSSVSCVVLSLLLTDLCGSGGVIAMVS